MAHHYVLREEHLYGRHWGATSKVKNLHFECCYYQGIEYCIKNNLKFFDPGVQGEHKIRRGFQPTLKLIISLFFKRGFWEAVSDFCKSERNQIENYIEACKSYTPFNNDYKNQINDKSLKTKNHLTTCSANFLG